MGVDLRRGDYPTRHISSMSKKIGFVLALFLLLLAAGAWIYFRNLRHSQVVLAPDTPSHSAPITVSPGAKSGSAASPYEPPATSENAAKNNGSVGPAPFSPRAGETLEFAANVPKLNSTVASLQLKVGDKRSFGDKNAWHFQAFAHTENPYRMVFDLDDQFDSYSDAANNMTSLQYEMHLNERGTKVDSVQRMLPSPNDPAPPNAAAARVLPGTRDPLGMLQYLRSVDWSKTPEVHSPVFDGRKLYDVRASLAAKSVPVSVPAGNFNASKIDIRVFDNGAEMKDAHFLLYLTNDSARTPVLMEAVLPVTTARVELTKVR
jgi:hypothetical protein